MLLAPNSQQLRLRSSPPAGSSSARRVGIISRPVHPLFTSATKTNFNEKKFLVTVSRSRTQRVVLTKAQDEPVAPAPVDDKPFPVEEDFDILSGKIASLVKELDEDLRGCSIYLVGMMGSGKTTVGRMLANTMKYAFFDTDSMVELTHDKKPVSEIFAEYGEEYFRQCEHEVLKQLSPYKNLIIATGGGAVTRPKNWSFLHSGLVAWLNGPTDLLAKRVAKEGIVKRPLLAPKNGEQVSDEQLYGVAKEKLDSILAERAKFYESADLKISLEGHGVDAENGAPAVVVMYRLLSAMKQRIEDTKREREEAQQFTIEDKGTIPIAGAVKIDVQDSQNKDKDAREQ